MAQDSLSMPASLSLKLIEMSLFSVLTAAGLTGVRHQASWGLVEGP